MLTFQLPVIFDCLISIPIDGRLLESVDHTVSSRNPVKKRLDENKTWIPIR